MQDHLDLHVTPRYFSNWFTAQWDTWQDLLLAYDLPADLLVRSQKSYDSKIANCKDPERKAALRGALFP